eukprot:6212322-Pleurochrysis_carterae.AAC.3
MSALPVIFSDVEEWKTADVLRARIRFPTQLDDADLALFAGPYGGASADEQEANDGSHSNGASLHSRRNQSSAGVESEFSRSSDHGRIKSQNAGSSTSCRLSSWSDAISAAHKLKQGAQYHDNRGKHDRTNTQKDSSMGCDGSESHREGQ